MNRNINNFFDKNVNHGCFLLQRAIKSALERLGLEFGEAEQKAINIVKERIFDCFELYLKFQLTNFELYINDQTSSGKGTDKYIKWDVRTIQEGRDVYIKMITESPKEDYIGRKLCIEDINELSKREFEEKDFDVLMM